MTIPIPNVRLRNQEILNAVIEDDSCHCTRRVRLSDTSARAIFEHNNEEAALVSWVHDNRATTVSWTLSIGSFFTRQIEFTADDDEIKSTLNSGFLQMHTLYGGSEYTGLSDDTVDD